MQLTIFFDGSCPLCLAEMEALRKYDQKNRLVLEDLNAPAFQEKYPEIDRNAAMTILHGYLSDGRLLLGLDVTYWAWKLVERKPWVAVLRWPVIRWFADKIYLFFARNRYGISYVMTGKRRCDPDARACSLPAQKRTNSD